MVGRKIAICQRECRIQQQQYLRTELLMPLIIFAETTEITALADKVWEKITNLNVGIYYSSSRELI